MTYNLKQFQNLPLLLPTLSYLAINNHPPIPRQNNKQQQQQQWYKRV
jgi:hypothetical protein